ncbi:hypothetical protein MPTK1_7g11140 [Marchantia polymorpha subsp. ruderalis]|uniref:Uncharacterized protein n=2 Tax=Marchantia polymorpha TaxID=3197 RepID=A0AAF6BYB5_MARPO|nr:hypothetical protein MARPO_0003s0128 [Marchantia polymorpha]BBN16999.1 hypothetical protein Mp_7g11140 [Marchantia polymorpha subsp. ruderalis]|eukprot:PTQ49237.1 hypothetical protein MARPO_0003s0128 [Marchantia polymorpha]
MTFRQKTMAKLGKEPAVPGYTGFIPAMRNHLIGHSYGDSTRRAAACTDSLRKKSYPKAIELTVESRPQDRNFFYAQLSRAALEQPPKAIHWIASKRDLPIEMTATSGLVDVRKMKTCIGTTAEGVTTCAPHMSIPDPPYKDRHLCTKREFEALKDDCLEVAEARHHIKGYSGHYHAKQHVYGKSYGKTTRELRPLPARPVTSREYQFYQDNRALMVNEFELKRRMKYNHFTLLPPGHKPGGHGYIEGKLEEMADYKSPSDEPQPDEPESSCSCPYNCLQSEYTTSAEVPSRPKQLWKFPDRDVIGSEKAESSSSAANSPWNPSPVCSTESTSDVPSHPPMPSKSRTQWKWPKGPHD